MNEDWLHKVHDRMSDYEIEAPDNLWDTIEEKLQIKSEPKRPIILMWAKRIISTAAILALLISLSLYLLKNDIDSPKTPLLSTTEKNTHIYIDNKPATVSPHTASTTSLATNQTKSSMTTFVNNEPKQSYSSRAIDAKDICDAGQSDELQSMPTSEASTKSTDSTDSVKPIRDNASTINATRYIASTINQSNRNKGHISFAMFTSGGTGSMLNNHSIGLASPSSLGPDEVSWEDNPALGILLFNKGQEISHDIKHRLPIRAGITFSYNINDRLGFESGVSYTNLKSDIREGSGQNYYIGEQNLHYIGIPLNLKYRIYSWKVIDIYASAGILAEKCVSAKIDKKYFIDYQLKSSESEKLSEKPLQWSVNSSLGVQCNLLKSLGIYVEPGASYYFNDGSDIQTIYKDKPLNFNLNLGIRFTFGK